MDCNRDVSLSGFGNGYDYLKVNEIYDRGEIPEDLDISIIIVMPEKVNECELHKTISLISHIIIIMNRA